MRKLIAALAPLVLVSLLGHTAEAQQTKKVPRIGYLSSSSPSSVPAFTDAFQ